MGKFHIPYEPRQSPESVPTSCFTTPDNAGKEIYLYAAKPTSIAKQPEYHYDAGPKHGIDHFSRPYQITVLNKIHLHNRPRACHAQLTVYLPAIATRIFTTSRRPHIILHKCMCRCIIYLEVSHGRTLLPSSDSAGA